MHPTDVKPRFRFRLPTVDELAAIALLGMGASVTVGWAWDLDSLKRFQPGLPQMMANTAFGLFLVGLGLLLHRFARVFPVLGRAALLSNAAALAIGLLTAVEYTGNWNLGVDEILFSDFSPLEIGHFPGRMTLDTAVCFTSLSIAGSMVVIRKAWFIAQALLIAVLAIAYVALFGYLFSAVPKSAWNDGAPMAVHTAASMIFGAIGYFSLTLRHGAIARVRPQLPTIAFLTAFFFISLAAYGAYFHSKTSDLFANRIAAAHQIQELLEDVAADTNGMTAAAYGFAATGTPSYLNTLEAEQNALSMTMTHLV